MKSTRTLTFLVIGLQLLLAVVVVVGALYNARKLRDEALGNNLDQAAAQVRSNEDYLTQTLYLASLTLSNLPELIGYDPYHGNAAQQNAALEKVQRQMPALRSLSLAGHDGKILASSVAANVGRHVDFAPLLPQAPLEHIGLARIGVPWEGRDFHDGRPSTQAEPVGARSNAFFPLAVALAGEPGLVAVAAINSDYFINHFSGSNAPAFGHVAVYDYNGTRLFSTVSDQPPGGRIEDPSLLARIRDREIGQSLDDMAHGIPVLTAFRASRNYPFVVIAHIDRTAALAKWRNETAALLALVALALAATLLITGLLTARLRTSIAKEARMQEERRLAARVFEHSNDGIIVTDAETRILTTNPAFERITGYSAAEAIGQTPRILSSGSHSSDFFEKLWRQLLDTGNWAGEITNRRKDGSLLTEWLAITRILDAQGRVASYVGVFKDLSETRRSEQTIRRLSLAVEQSPNSILITSLEPAIEYVNPQFTRATGYSAAEAIGQNPRLLQSGLTPFETYRDMWKNLLAGENWEGEFVNRRKDGSIYHERATIAPIKNAQGEITHYLAIQHDITEQKRLEQALIEARDAAEASSRAKSEFLANMSHEIRTPMNGIIGMTQLALESGLSQEQASLVRKAHGAAISLLGILNDILDFSKIEAGRLEFEHLPFDLDGVLDHLRDLFEVAAAGKGLQLSLRLDADVPVHLIGDPMRLAQVLTNLIGNAIKFTRSGQVTVHVALSGQAADDPDAARLLFEIADTGIGMSEAQVGRLFQAFRQGDSSTTREYGGTGLGLAISHRLVGMMNGRIDVKSAPDAGSCFSFSVSFKRSPNPVHPQPRAVREQRTNLAGLSVLLVEDNQLNQQLARSFLERADMSVTIAGNGAEALAHLDHPGNPAFDIVLMDIQMPVMDGLTATRHIRADARLAHLPIIATTAHAMAEDREQCIATGMQDYLTKPIDVGQLYAKISQWTGRTDNLTMADATGGAPGKTATEMPVSHALADRDAAIERIGGHAGIYREVIATFLADQRQTARKLRDLLAASDVATAHRIAHTLKGTAATIGATPLFDAALALDRDLKNGTLPDDWPARMDAIENRLAATLSAIQAELSSSTD